MGQARPKESRFERETSPKDCQDRHFRSSHDGRSRLDLKYILVSGRVPFEAVVKIEASYFSLRARVASYFLAESWRLPHRKRE